MRGDMHHLNVHFPYQAIGANSSIVGIGATPEGIDQNPIYYEFLYEQAFRQQPVDNLTAHIIHMNFKRYDLIEKGDDIKFDISRAWGYLMESSYAQDFSVQDQTGVAHLSPREAGSLFESDRSTPKPILCGISKAWRHLIEAAQKLQSRNITVTSPFLFDLVNVGREVLAQLSTPMALNFSDVRVGTMDRTKLIRTGGMYINLLVDLDSLVGTIDAFQLVPWLQSARRLAESDDAGVQYDCLSPILHNSSGRDDDDCRRFYEWNARCQITTWHPTPSTASRVPGGPIDYAAKHWSGLIREYYAERARILLFQALRDQENGSPLNDTALQRRFARHAYEWSTGTMSSTAATEGHASPISRDDYLRIALAASKEMLGKYSKWFETCWQPDTAIL
jgi:alpha-N-acetylglucosaminidase